jgi:SAM-dependent methyltransferase
VTEDIHHHALSASRWVVRFAPLIPAGGWVLDLAAGAGRHSRYLASLGYKVQAIDRDQDALAALDGLSGVHVRAADLENAPWPYTQDRFAGIVVINYLHRPLFPRLLAALEEGGVLIYETFARGNQRYGKPSNPDYLLEPGELLEVARGRLRVLAYEDLFVSEPKPAMLQRICAFNGTDSLAFPDRWRLQ